MLKSRAQSTIETLVILATALFILTALVAIVYNQLNASYVQEQQQLAVSALSTLAKEVDDAYFLGPGTVKNLVINFPDLVDLDNSYISGRDLVLRVNGSDFVKNTRVDVRGLWPNTSGSFVFTITAFDDFVLVSTQKMGVSPSQIVESIKQGNSKDVNIVLTNNTAESINYLVDVNFPFLGTGSSFSLSEESVSVGAAQSSFVTLTLNCSRDSFGSYSGLVTFVAQSSLDSNISVPINVVCSSAQTKLVIYPSTKNIFAYPDETFSDSVLVCNNSSTNFSYSKSSIVGPVSNYVLVNFSQSIPANSCKTATLNFNAPSSEGSYSGLLLVESSGFTATIDLNLIVSNVSNTLDVSWDNAYFSVDSNKIIDANIVNVGALVVVEEVMVLFPNDLDDANVTNFFVRGIDLAPALTKAGSGEWINVTDFNVGSMKSYDLNIVFDANVNDDSEKFRVVFKLSNGQTIWSQIFDPTSTVIDFLEKHFSDTNIGREPIYPQDANLIWLRKLNNNTVDSISGVEGSWIGTEGYAQGLWDTNSANFDGVNSGIDLGGRFPKTSGTLSISLWVNFGSVSGSRYLVGEDDATNRNFAFYLLNGNTLRFFVFESGGGSSIADYSWVPEVGVWYNLIAVADGEYLNTYVDGKKVAISAAYNGTLRDSDENTFIGIKGNLDFDFVGKIDEVALWNKALSEEEVREIYFIGAGKFDSNVQGTSSGITLSGSEGSYLSDGNFYSRVFDFNGTVDLNSISWTSLLSGTANSSTNLSHDLLLSDYSSSSFSYKSSDKNFWAPTGSLDWNAKDFGSEFNKSNYSEFPSFSSAPLSPSNSLWDSSLLALWHLDNNLEDVVGPADGSASPTYSRGIYDGNGLYCQGIAENFAFVNSNSHLNVPNFTFNSWIKPDSNVGGGFYTHGGGNGYSAGFRVIYDATNQRVSNNWGSGTAYDGVVYSAVGSVPVYGWSMVTATYDGSAMRIYVNGEYQSIDTSVNYGYASTANGHFCRCDGGTVFKGTVEETAVWSRALSNTEITSLYSSQAGKFSEPNIIGLWKMNLNTLDSSFYGNHATTGAFNSDENTSGLWDTNAFLFDGLNDHLMVADNNDFDYRGGGITLSAWIKPDLDENDTGYIFSKPYSSGGLYNYRFYYDANFALGFYLYNGSSSTSLKSDNNIIKPGYWSHVVLIVQPNKKIKIFVNGLMVAYSSHSLSTWGSSSDQERALTIGGIYPWGDGSGSYTQYFLKGKMEEAIVWNKALTQKEVTSLYQSQFGSVLDENLVALWHLNNNANDSSGNGYNGSWGGDETYSSGLWDTNAAVFDGNNEFIQFSLDKNLTYNFSTSFWVKPNSISGQQYMLEGFAGKPYIARDGDEVRVTFRNCIDSTWVTYLTNSDVFKVGLWSMISVVYDKGLLRVFANGVKIYENSSVESCVGGTPASIWYIGGRSTVFFDGSIEEVAVWDRSLLVDEVKAMYESQKGKWLDPNLVFYYKMDSRSSSTVLDSARGINGTLSASANIDAKGMWDSNALNCGTIANVYSVTIADRNEIDIIGDQTIRMWLHPTNVAGGRQNPFNKAYGGEGTMTQETSGGINYFYGTYGGNGSPYQAYGLNAGTIQNNKWIYVVLVRNLSEGTLAWYVNGALQKSTTATYTAAKASTGDLLIGRGYTGTPYAGFIDEVAVWNRALSANEILADYNNFSNSKFVQSTKVTIPDYNSAQVSVKINSGTGYSFGSELESKEIIPGGLNEINSSNKLFDSNLVGLWHFNGDANDYSGRENHGVAYGGVSDSSGLWDNNAFSFDGNNDYVGIPKSTLFQEQTTSFWFKYSSGAGGTIMSSLNYSGSGHDGYIFGLSNNSLGYAVFANSVSNVFSISSSVNPDRWIHVLATHKSGQSKLYINGAEASSSSVSFSFFNVSAPPDTDIGRYNYLNNGYVSVIVDEVALWDRALSSTEVKYLYDSQVGAFAQESNLIGLWNLNGDANDSSGNDRNGTIYGNTSVVSGLWDTNAYTFDGSGDYIDAGVNPITGAGAFTLSSWINTTRVNTYQGALTIGASSSYNSAYIGTVSTAQVGLANSIGGGFYGRNYGSGFSSTNTWAHVALTYNGTTARLYLNGILAVSENFTPSLTSENIRIGRIGTTSSHDYSGKIDDAAVWDRALSADEILNLYRKGISRIDLNVYSCADENCNLKIESNYIAKAKNNYLHDTNLVNSKYLGFDAFFKPASFSDFSLLGNYYVNSFLSDFNFVYDYTDHNFSVRASDDGVVWNNWTNVGRNPGNLLIEGVKYFQYKTNLSSYNPNVSPLISDVNLFYTRQGS